MLWIIVALIVFIFQIATILILEFRHPSKTVAWLMILFILPIVGFVMYYFLAKEFRQRRMVRDKGHKVGIPVRTNKTVNKPEELDNEEMHHQHRLFALLRHLPDTRISKCNEVQVLTNGENTYKAIMDAIEQAEDHIHFEFYTIRADRIGCRFQQLLIKKAKQGVKVRVIYDGVGSYELENSYLNDLRNAGVECFCFLPPFIAFFDKRVNYRNHRKIVVVDGKVGFLGGINIGDEYLGGNPKLGFWRDTHLMLEGDAVCDLQHTFIVDWSFVSGEELSDDIRYYPEHECTGKQQVQILRSGPDHWDGILELFFASIGSATQRIYITSPYFIPDYSITIALKTAAISGVDVRIIIPSVADTKIVFWASLSYVEDLMEAGVKFYQYQRGFIHAKMLLIDHKLAIVGTANMDMRSFFSNFELNAVMFDKNMIERLEVDFMQDMEDSKQLVLAEFEKRSKIQKSKEVLARLLSPLL